MEHQVGTLGEYLQVYTDAGSAVANWTKGSVSGTPLTWYMLDDEDSSTSR